MREIFTSGSVGGLGRAIAESTWTTERRIGSVLMASRYGRRRLIRSSAKNRAQQLRWRRYLPTFFVGRELLAAAGLPRAYVVDMSPANSSRPIADLIADASSADVRIAGLAARELMHRHEECTRHTAVLVRQLSHRNAAIADLAFRTLERMGSSSVAELLAALPASTGRFRCDLLGLLSAVGDFDTIFPVLQNELEHGTEESRFWAANCLGRRVARGVEWPTDALATLERCVDLLLSCRRQPELMVHWPQARMTLKHLGKLPRDAT